MLKIVFEHASWAAFGCILFALKSAGTKLVIDGQIVLPGFEVFILRTKMLYAGVCPFTVELIE